MARGILALAMLAASSVAAPVAHAQDDPIDEVTCGSGPMRFAGIGRGAWSVTVDDADVRPAQTSGIPAVGPSDADAVAAIGIIPPSAAAAGIASGARSFRTTAGTAPAYMTPYLGSVVFSARDAARGRELWIATPTTARRLKDIAPGDTSSSPRDFVVLDDIVYFTASDGSHGRELWRSDGTSAGTRMVKDIRRGTRGSNPGALTVFQGRLYFPANDGPHASELWRSDGTSAGTRMVKDINPDGEGVYDQRDPGEPSGWAVMGDHLYFPAYRQAGELWRTDGTSAGTRRVLARMAVSVPIVVAASRLYFKASHDDGGCALDGPFLFTSDGTSGGTAELTAAAYPWGELVSYRNRAWFGNHVERADSISDRPRLWRSAGANATTVQARPTVSMDIDTPLLAVGRRLFMSIGRGLAASDERGLNAKVLGDTASGWRATVEVVSVGPRWYFPAGQGRTRELWRTDGTPATTRLALDVNPSGNGAVGSLVSADGVIWFVADDGIRGQQLWRYVPSSR
jgi:ELWxxDGT repeat protein